MQQWIGQPSLPSGCKDRDYIWSLLTEGLDKLDVGMSLFGPDLTLLLFNDRARTVLDLPAELAQSGVHLSRIFRYNAERGDYGEGDIDTLVAERMALVDKGLPHSFERSLACGRIIEVVGQPLSGGGFITTFEDITERRKTQAVKEMLGDIVDKSLNEIYVFDALTLRFIEVNTGARRNLGYSMEQLYRLTPLDIKPDLNRLEFDLLIEPLQLKRAEKITYETRHKRKDGSCYDVEVHLQLMNADGTPVFVAIMQDITHRKQAERAILQSRDTAMMANRAKSEFLANMSHELRTPLNSILGFSEAMRDCILGPHSNPKYQDYAASIHLSGSLLLGIINDILDVSKIESGNMVLEEDLTCLREMIHSCVNIVEGRARDKNIDLAVKLEKDLPIIYVDERRMKQVVINLLTNAIKFTEENGRVTIRARSLDNDDVMIEVSDTGVGIPRDKQGSIFQPFVRLECSSIREYEGIGLGLSIVKAMVEEHGGSIHLDSQPGVGSSLFVRLPARRRAAVQGS